jgi:hypothetical protein
MNGLDRAVYVHTNSSVTPLIKQPIGPCPRRDRHGPIVTLSRSGSDRRIGRGAIYGNYASLAAQVTL